MCNDAPSVSYADHMLRTVGHMGFLPRGIRLRLVNKYRNTDTTPDRRFSVPFFGLTYNGSLACEIDRQVFFFGVYEPEILSLFRNILATMDSPVVVDVGANVGHHTLYLSKFAQKVHSFEPWPKVRSQLLQKLADNNIQNVKVYEVALGSEDEAKVYYAPEGGNTGTGSFLSTHAQDRNRPSEQLQIVNGDEYFRENGIGQLDFVKIDVEGWEWFVLLGLAGTIQRYRPIVLFECSLSTRRTLHSRSQLTMFSEYEFFLVGRHPKPIHGEALPTGNLLLIPAEKVVALRDRL